MSVNYNEISSFIWSKIVYIFDLICELFSFKKDSVITISSDTDELFDKLLNVYLEFGWIMVEGTYKKTTNDDKIVISQVVKWNKKFSRCKIWYHENNKFIVSIYKLINGKIIDGKYPSYDENGNKYSERTIINGFIVSESVDDKSPFYFPPQSRVEDYIYNSSGFSEQDLPF